MNLPLVRQNVVTLFSGYVFRIVWYAFRSHDYVFSYLSFGYVEPSVGDWDRHCSLRLRSNGSWIGRIAPLGIETLHRLVGTPRSRLDRPNCPVGRVTPRFRRAKGDDVLKIPSGKARWGLWQKEFESCSKVSNRPWPTGFKSAKNATKRPRR